MQLPIPEEIRRALDSGEGRPVELCDPRTQTRYVLVPAEEYEQLHDAQSAAVRDTYAAQDAVARAAGWDDPEMDDYNDYGARRPTGSGS